MHCSRWGLLLVVACAATACGGASGSDIDGVCTATFAMHTVRLEDGLGAPIVGASLTATLARTGEVLQPTTLALMSEGVYVVVDDGSVRQIRAGGDRVNVRITTPSASRDVAYVFASDGCHVERVSGPTTVTIE